MEKVLLINASAKSKGATQKILTVIENELSDSLEVKSICLGDLNLSFCKGCKKCYDTTKCVIRDDMDLVISLINQAEKIVICAPSYWADVPGQFKVFIDRCTPFSDTNPNTGRFKLSEGKKCYAIALRTGQRPVECEHIIDCIEHWCSHLGIEMVDSMYFCEIKDASDIDKHKSYISEKSSEWFLSNDA